MVRQTETDSSLPHQKRGKRMKQTTIENATVILPEDYQLNLSDFALFLSVMKVQKAYEDALSIILEEPGLTLKEIKVEQVILNKAGKRAIRLDAWASDEKNRQFDMEMQNEISGRELRRRARFYQGLLDTPILKSGKATRYKHLPSTVIIFITQEDIFGKDLAKYTFSEWCEEVPDLPLEDGTAKIFLNMASKNGDPVLVSLLQYMKNTTLDNPDIMVKDERIIDLDRIVNEVKQTEEWEAVKMNILEIGLEKGEEIGKELGREEGRKEGRKEGKEEGRKEGKAEGEARVNHLIQLLIKQARTGEIEKAVTDKEFQQTLFTEFGI